MARRLRNIRLVTFDLFDTLYTPRESVEKTYTAPLLRHGIKVKLQSVGEGLSLAMKYMCLRYPNYGYGVMSSRDWWRQVIDRTWAHIGVPPTYLGNNHLLAERESLIDYFNTSEGYRMYQEVPRVLKYLTRRGIKIGVVSNMDEAGERVLYHLGIRPYFDFVLQSVTAGIQKPDPRIFDMALSAVNVPAFDALHVGDNEVMDYDAARNAGMEARIVCRTDDAAELAAKQPEKYMTSLDALLKIL
ncbi:Haloacid dehalogenase-like hydrolase domain-containing protein 3 [Coemansia sp. RSA 552]|nr:Haloacid dehalogenase-like hydrolase domain-containing protein 3 [Coemansia sp. RSA 552]